MVDSVTATLPHSQSHQAVAALSCPLNTRAGQGCGCAWAWPGHGSEWRAPVRCDGLANAGAVGACHAGDRRRKG